MIEILNGIIIIGFLLAFFAFGIGMYMNIYIYYSEDKDKFTLFPILSPFSFDSYELIFNSMSKLNWKIENENKKLKYKSNKLRRFSGMMLLIALTSGILSSILN